MTGGDLVLSALALVVGGFPFVGGIVTCFRPDKVPIKVGGRELSRKTKVILGAILIAGGVGIWIFWICLLASRGEVCDFLNIGVPQDD
ncbi:MAG TPA: hypothetical protein DCX07_05085 [Phycisphaerales bacterium]|nr:hypothetical protein [Phycisphaerales bacterium]